jgi:heat shock protein HslJ
MMITYLKVLNRKILPSALLSLLLMPFVLAAPAAAAGEPRNADLVGLQRRATGSSSRLMAESNPELEGVLWQLTSYTDAEGNTVPALPLHNRTPSAQFLNGQMVGNGACNRFFRAYDLDGDGLTIQAGGSTFMNCPPEVVAQEQAFSAAMGNVAHYDLSEGRLRLMDANGNILLTFSTEAPMALRGTLWQLTGYDNGQGEMTAPMAATAITATFSPNGSLGGTAGCNSYRTSYDLNGARLSFDPVDSTNQLCQEPDGLMDQESAYLQTIETVATYVIEGHVLTLKNESGAAVAQFVAHH